MTFNQNSFAGGLNLLSDDTRLQPNEYRLGFNLRNRFDTLVPNLTTVQDQNAPVGIKQGLFAISLNVLILFCAGKAYYRLTTQTVWTQIAGFQMSTTAYRLFAEIVPASTLNLNRFLVTPGITSSNSPLKDVVQTSNVTVNGTPACMIVQDGSNQPWIIYIDPLSGLPLSRVSQNYADWTMLNREYIPIGTQMAYFSGKLYVVSPDGHTILSSVTGRPMDFVINIDINGDKGGDAYTTSYSVSFDPISCMIAVNSAALFVSTQRSSFSVTPNLDITFFGEPTFNSQLLFEAGCVNQFSFIDILGDYAFIDHEGLRSFNAIVQEKNEGRNSIFSLKITRAFKNILQSGDFNCAISFDNYGLFSVNTIYGKCLVIYDYLAKVFVGMDFAITGKGFKQMARFETGSLQLFGIAEDNEVYHIYGGDSYEVCSVQTGSWCSGQPSIELKPQKFRTVFVQQKLDGDVNVSCYVNNKRVPTNMSGTKSQQLKATMSGVGYPAYYPVLYDSGDTVYNMYFQFSEASQGWKHNFMVRWSGGATLTNMQSDVSDLTPMQPLQTQAKNSLQQFNP